MIAQAVMFGFNIGEISCPTKYFKEASSINFKRSVKYGWACWHFVQLRRAQVGNLRKKSDPRLLLP
jgi:hypothetical protein